MGRYALLVRESSNRVFAAAAPALLAAEVEAIGSHLSGGMSDGETIALGGLDYFCFESSDLTDADLFLVSNLALARGVFEVIGGDALRPIALQPLEWFDTDLITIQRYVGKTNEQFTHLLVNLAVSASRSAHHRASAGERVRLLDPVSGRGSTLNRGLVYGFDVGGVEVDESHVDQHRIFLTTYLKDHRIKHKAQTERIRKGPLAGTSAFDVAIRPGDPAVAQRVKVARASTENTAQLFAGKKFDVIAGDLPYGIHHTSKGGAKAANHGSPEQLVADSLVGWRQVMAPGAALGLSWNVHTLSREALGNQLVGAGLEVVEHSRSFEHRVDRQITRDLIVGRLPVS